MVEETRWREQNKKQEKVSGPKLHDWKKQIIPINVTKLLDLYRKNRQDKRPKLRALFYHLLQDGFIKIKSSVTYDTFSSEMSEARLESGIIPLDSLRDDVRPHVIMPDERLPERVVGDAVDLLMNIYDYYVPYRWKHQKVWLEIWIEKDAVQDDFQHIIDKNGLQVVLQVNRGQEGTTALRNAYLRLARKQKEGKKIVLQYYGDQDAPGEDMDDDLLRRLQKMAIMDTIKMFVAKHKDMSDEEFRKGPEIVLKQIVGEEAYSKYRAGRRNLTPEEQIYYSDSDIPILQFGSDQFEFRRIALTDEQVNNPELRLEKLDEKQRDELNWSSLKRIDRNFVNKHGSSHQVELDGLVIKDQFEDIVVNAVNEYFDWDLWKKRVQYEEMGALPRAEMELEMTELLHELNMKFGYKNENVSKADVVNIRQKAWDKVSKLRGRVLAIRGRHEGLPEHRHLKDSYDWLARQEAKGRKIGVDIDIEEDD